jgi:hypothetical protein
MQHLRTITSMEEDFKALGIIPNSEGHDALVKDLTEDIGQHNSLIAPLRKLAEDKNADLEAVKNATREAMKVRKSGNIQQASDMEKKRDEMIKKAKGLGYGQDAEDAATEVEGEQVESEETDKFFIVSKAESTPFSKGGKEHVLDGFPSKEEAEKALPKWKQEYKDAHIVDHDPVLKEGEEMNEGKQDVIKDIMGLSSGTLASLTGKKEYEYLDKLQGKFTQFAIGALDSDPNAFKDWKEAWKYFSDSYDLETFEPKQGEFKTEAKEANKKFKNLSIGDEFVFASQNDPKFQFSGMARGPWIKKSIRGYVHVDDPETMHKVGTLDVEVEKKNEEVSEAVRCTGDCPKREPGNINLGGANLKDDEESVLKHFQKTHPNVKKVYKSKTGEWLPDFEDGKKMNETKEEDIAYETENFYAIKTQWKRSTGYEIFQNGPTHATKVATIGYDDLERVKKEIARREALLAKEKNVSESKMNAVKVTYDNGDEVVTSINGSDEEVLSYFKVGKTFNIGNGGKDLMAKVVKAEIVPSEMNEAKKEVWAIQDWAGNWAFQEGGYQGSGHLHGPRNTFDSFDDAEEFLTRKFEELGLDFDEDRGEYEVVKLDPEDHTKVLGESTELSEAIKAQRLKKMKPAAKAKARRAYRKQKSKISRKLKKLRKKPSYKRRKAKLKKLKKGKKAGARRRLVLAGLGNIGKLAEAILANTSLLKEEKMTQEQFLVAFESIENMANVMCKKYANLISMIEEDETDLDYVGQEWDELDDFQDEGDEVEADDEDLGHVGQEWDDLEDFEEPGEDVEDEYEDENDKEYVGDEIEESRNLMNLRCLIEDVRSTREHLANGKRMDVKKTISEMTQALANMMKTYVQEAFAYVGDDEPESENKKPEAPAKNNKYVGDDEPNAEKQKPEAPLGGSKYVGEEPNAEKQKPVSTLKGNKYVGKDGVDAEKAKPEAPKQNKYVGKDKPEEDNDKPAEPESVGGKHVGEKPYGTAQAGKVIPTIK